MLLLQHRTGLSDEQAMEAVCWDLRWNVALGLAVDHAGWHPTTEHLRRTRPRIERLLALLAHRYGARKTRYSRWQ